MKRFLCLTLLLALSAVVPLTAGEPSTRVTVAFVAPEKFTDVRDSALFDDSGRNTYLEQIRDHLLEQAPKYLAEGQSLEITFTDIDLAGDFELWRGPRFFDVRMIRDIYPPRLEFSFRLLDATGKVVKEARRSLLDLAFQLRSSVLSQHDTLRYEKAMLEDWLRDEFPRPTKR
jgi:hypothetical protein